MRTRLVAVLVSTVVGTLVQPALARNEGKLPKGGVPVSAEVAKGVFAGKTVKNSNTSVYMDPNGTAVAIYPKRAFAEDTWKVSGNEVCETLTWHGKIKADGTTEYASCKSFYIIDKVMWTENTKDEPEWQGDIYPGFEKRIKKGDQVSKLVNAFKIRNGY